MLPGSDPAARVYTQQLPCFAPPLLTSSFHSTLTCNPGKCNWRNRATYAPLLPRLQVVAQAGWQDAVFSTPEDADTNKAFERMQTQFPNICAEAYLLGTCEDAKSAYCIISTSTKTKGTRATYAMSSFAMPFPLTCPMDKFIIQDCFSVIAADVVSPNSLIALDTSFVTRLLPADLLRKCSVDAAKAGEIGMTILRNNSSSRTLNAAAVFLQAVDTLRVRVVGASLEEVESLTTDALTLSGFLFVERETARIYGEVVYSGKLMRVKCTPAVALAVANAAKRPCYLPREIFDTCSVSIVDMVSAFSACGQKPVVRKQERRTSSDTSCLPRMTEPAKQRFSPWEMKAAEVLEMSDESLRLALRECEVGVTSTESRNSLLRKFVELMDEVERRELGIIMAADGELYGLAGELQAMRSKRGKLLAKLRQAEEAEQWIEAARIGERIRVIESQTADITAEPGSYSSFLDQDEWYRPNR